MLLIMYVPASIILENHHVLPSIAFFLPKFISFLLHLKYAPNPKLENFIKL